MPDQLLDDWPVFIHGNLAVARWTHFNGKQRIYLIARGNGLFAQWSEHLTADETAWVMDDDPCSSIYDSEETAVREINSIYPWSREVPREDYE